MPDDGTTYNNAEWFEFDLAGPFFLQVVRLFESLEAAPLTETNISDLEESKGVYGLLKNGELVYVGKSDGDLRKRLREHKQNISSRNNISIDEMTFKCVYIASTWVPLAPEDHIIKHYIDQDVCTWNRTGFGNHDPGRNREETNKPPDGFDNQYPIRENYPVHGLEAGNYECNDLLKTIKSALPFTFRYQTDNPKAWQRGSTFYNGKRVEIPRDNMPVNEVLHAVLKELGDDWQVTLFPSHIIMYRERRHYEFGTKL